MKILHITDVNWVGISSTFVKYHRVYGNEARMVTFVKNPWGFPEDITLNLPLTGFSNSILYLRRILNFIYRRPIYSVREDGGRVVRVWRPRSGFERFMYGLRDSIWAGRIYRKIREYGLMDFDIYQLDGGRGFFRDGRVIRKLKRRGKKVVVYYFGTDFRDRGIVEPIDSIADLRITTEFDHYLMDPTLKFDFLPVEVERFKFREEENRRLRIFHAIRSPINRDIKGTDFIVQAMERLRKEFDFEFRVFEGLPHEEFLRLKSGYDICIEQIGNRGGTGYGMNGIENLAMGIVTVTEFTREYEEFLKNHPFYTVNKDNFMERMRVLLRDGELRRRLKFKGRRWVEDKHDVRNVIKRLYGYYRSII